MSLNLKQIIDIENNQEVKLYPKRGITLEKGEGVYLIDTSGKKYLDFMTNLGVNILGYSNPQISQAISKQLETLPSTHQTFYSQPRAVFLKELKTVMPEYLSQVIFTNSGAESVEAALKLAMLATGKSGFIAAKNAYHGRTLGSLTVTGQEKYKLILPESYQKKADVVHVPFNDIKALKKAINKNTAAIILEPIQGEIGIAIPEQNYLSEVKSLCSENNILLILDEIQTAIRTGSFCAFEQFGALPDILCLSKSWSYGIPFGLVITSEKIASSMPKGGHGSTFAGGPLACTAALEVIKTIKKNNLLKNAAGMGKYFLEELKKIKNPKIKKVRGRGLMIGLELTENVTPYLKSMQDKGLIAASSNSNTIRFLPPIIISKKEIDQALKIMRKVFN